MGKPEVNEPFLPDFTGKWRQRPCLCLSNSLHLFWVYLEQDSHIPPSLLHCAFLRIQSQENAKVQYNEMNLIKSSLPSCRVTEGSSSHGSIWCLGRLHWQMVVRFPHGPRLLWTLCAPQKQVSSTRIITAIC